MSSNLTLLEAAESQARAAMDAPHPCYASYSRAQRAWQEVDQALQQHRYQLDPAGYDAQQQWGDEQAAGNYFYATL